MWFAYSCVIVLFVVFLAECFTQTSQARVPRCTGGPSLRGLSLAQFLESINSETPLACCDEDGVCYESQKPGDLPTGTSTFNLSSTHWANFEKGMNSRSKREVHYCPDSCPLPAEINVCPSNTSIVFPLSGTSIISEKRVEIAQYPPVLIQPVIYHRCLMSECRILGGSCVQVLVPQAVFVYAKNGDKVETEIDFVYVEGGCKCVPEYGKHLRGNAVQADPVIATVFRAATGRRLDFAALQAHLMSPDVLHEDMRGLLHRFTPKTSTTDATHSIAESEVTVTSTLPDPVTTTRSKIASITETPLQDLIMTNVHMPTAFKMPMVGNTAASIVELTTASTVQLTIIDPVELRRITHNVEPDTTVDSSIPTTLNEDDQSTTTDDPELREISTTPFLATTDGVELNTSYPTTREETQGTTQEDAIPMLLPADEPASIWEHLIPSVDKVYEIRTISQPVNETGEKRISEVTISLPADKQSTTDNLQEVLWERSASNADEDNEIDVLSLTENKTEQPEVSERSKNEENAIDQHDHVILNEQEDEDPEQVYTVESLSVTELVDTSLLETGEIYIQHDTPSSRAFFPNFGTSDPKSSSASEDFQTAVSTEPIDEGESSATKEAEGSATLEFPETGKLEDTEERSGDEEMQARSLEPEEDEELKTHDSQDSHPEEILKIEDLPQELSDSDPDPNLVLYDQNSVDPDDVFIDDNQLSETNEIDFTNSEIVATDQSNAAPLQATSDLEEYDESLSNEPTPDLEEPILEPDESEEPETRAMPESIHPEASDADGEKEVIAQAEDSADTDNVEHSENDVEPLTPSVVYLEDDEDSPKAEDPTPDPEELETTSLEHEPLTDVEDTKQKEDVFSLLTTSPSAVASDDVMLSTTKPLRLTGPDTVMTTSGLETTTSEPSENPPNEAESHTSPFQYLLSTFTQFFATKQPDIETPPPTVSKPTEEVPPETTESIADEVEDLRNPLRTLPVEQLPCANCPISIPPKYFDPIKKLLKKYST